MTQTIDQQTIDLARLGRENPAEFMTRCLDVRRAFMWSKMIEMSNSMRDHERTSVGAGHGCSKTYTMARLALTFLYSNFPSTVVTTAPTGNQVKNVLWREIRTAHTKSKIPLGGKLMTTMLDLQPDTGVRWFATGFSTQSDTVTQEATAFQGYHNDNLLIIFDEAAGILPEIWRAAEHIGAPYKRFVAIGNPTAGVGDFANSLRDSSFNHITISVCDTPNYQKGETVIPGLYGKEYVDRIAQKYGIDSDEYKVRVLGQISRKRSEGAYYSGVMSQLRRQERIGRVGFDSNQLVYIVIDPGYTTATWLFQPFGTDVRFIRYYEDSGVGIDGYGKLFRQWEKQYGYSYGDVFVPCDSDSNAHKQVHGDTVLDVLKEFGFPVRPLPIEKSVVMDGIPRTHRFLSRCLIDEENCKRGIECLETYHERVNKHLSTDEKKVFTGVPEKDGFDHGCDAMRYASMVFELGYVRTSNRFDIESYRNMKREYGY